MRSDRRDDLDETECSALLQRLFPRGFCGGDVRAELPGIDFGADHAERVGQAVWDIFSDNHDVVAADGRVADLGSWRGSAGFIAELLNEELGSRRHDYMDFYMGSLGWGRIEEGDRTLGPLYEMIFRRLKAEGCDWEYSFPRIYLVDYSRILEDHDRGGAEGSGYDPSVAVAAQLEAADRDEKRARLEEDLDDAHRQAIEEARGGPPPETVKAYRNVFGCLPRGWPPSV